MERLSKSARERLAQDDAEIKMYERKLGIKGRKSSRKDDDGLGELLGEDMDMDQSDEDSKRKRDEYETWLASKRRKSTHQASADDDLDLMDEDDEDDEDEEDDEGDEDDEDEDGADFENDSFGGFSDDEDDEEDDEEENDEDNETPAQPRQRENPYVAPTTGVTVAKYVPPSLRRATGSEEENRNRLRKQVQGLINRLTDDNILSIVQSVEDLYQKNARGDVTDIITDVVMAQICNPQSLTDQFLVTTGGFLAAVYRIIGSSFGGHLIRRMVVDFNAHYEQASKDVSPESPIQKEPSNILSLLAQLYFFEVVSCKIMFDYMERLLGDLTEINVELLLRICRMAGQLLRRDDPQALKHVSTALNQSISKSGYDNVSVRTKIMADTITDLNKHKKKARGLDSSVVSERVQRVKKRLGELKSQSRRLDGLAPMGMGLVDIEGADTRGEWWLVGASVPETLLDKSRKGSAAAAVDADYESSDSEDMDIVLPDFPKKAREQGLRGNAQIAIFTALMTASNYEHGYKQFVNLRLKKNDQLEIAKVLVQCVGSEMEYNPYYALVGRQACSSNSRIRFAIQDRLWKIFRSLGESLFGEGAEEDETADGERMKDERRLGNIANFYASLVDDGVLSIAILKPVELPEANHWTSVFVQLFIIALLKTCRSRGNSAKEDAKVEKLFGGARELPGLAAGIHWMLRKKVRKTKLASAKELKKLEGVREKAQAIVQAVTVEG
ncbi:suppressor of glycerol defect [Fusarium falciforme]|uniref:Suppressor of glycerol defect n=1 Tax=Fusarium falciforme TaxID=195108 RepID=A0A9W8RH73_9HYPO|nr:suppressor of glycerol defect [Fusarium falciforme]KAJ4181566.1 suppressor of glycerol defect [Fusarium falciforme]KAJ4197332.1 suppressor of glycerol defect [Fusarium falciforme]KAJ4262829.1 suppressor of glycerol defect [Fusarium falciforme]